MPAISDPSGAFHFSALPPGRFHVKLAASGLAPLAADVQSVLAPKIAPVLIPDGVVNADDPDAGGQ